MYFLALAGCHYLSIWPCSMVLGDLGSSRLRTRKFQMESEMAEALTGLSPNLTVTLIAAITITPRVNLALYLTA